MFSGINKPIQVSRERSSSINCARLETEAGQTAWLYLFSYTNTGRPRQRAGHRGLYTLFISLCKAAEGCKRPWNSIICGVHLESLICLNIVCIDLCLEGSWCFEGSGWSQSRPFQTFYYIDYISPYRKVTSCILVSRILARLMICKSQTRCNIKCKFRVLIEDREMQ